MSLESPAISATDWINFSNRLMAIEAALGMTNKDALAEATGDIASSLFKFGNSVPTSDVIVTVKTVSGSFSGTSVSQDVSVTWSEIPSGFEIYPIISLKASTAAKKFSRATMIGTTNSSSPWYTPNSTTTVRIFSQNEDGTATGVPFDFTVYVVGFCKRA